jgi:hypothetical protein
VGHEPLRVWPIKETTTDNLNRNGCISQGLIVLEPVRRYGRVKVKDAALKNFRNQKCRDVEKLRLCPLWVIKKDAWNPLPKSVYCLQKGLVGPGFSCQCRTVHSFLLPSNPTGGLLLDTPRYKTASRIVSWPPAFPRQEESK